MGNLENIFEKRLKQLGLKNKVGAAMIVENAQNQIFEVFGDKGKTNLRVVSFKDGALKIAAKNNAWAAECQANINKFKNHNVSRVIFVVDVKNDKELSED